MNVLLKSIKKVGKLAFLCQTLIPPYKAVFLEKKYKLAEGPGVARGIFF